MRCYHPKLVIISNFLKLSLVIISVWIKAVSEIVLEVTLNYAQINEIMKLFLQLSINTLKESQRQKFL